MNQRLHRENQWERLSRKAIALTLALMMVVTQMPFSQLVYAETNMAKIDIVEQDGYTKVLRANDIQESVKKMELRKNGNVLDTKDVSGALTFNVHTNGEYQLIGLDASGEAVDTQKVIVDTFKDISVDFDLSTHQVTILSRYGKTAQVQVEGTETTILSPVEKDAGVFTAVYDVKKNGVYTFSILDSDKQVLGKENLDVQSLPVVDEEGEIKLSNENDLKQMIANPSGTFVLEQDIEMTSDELKDLEFTGKLKGNGFTLSGIKEALFHSVSGADISNIVIKGSLAKTSKNTTISDTGFYVEAKDKEKDYGVILESTNTKIDHSFALLNVEGKNVAGFILEGTGTIENSYVSGYLRGEKVYGFAKEADLANSYIVASLVGDERILFSKGERKDCFYDGQINDLDDAKAMPYYTKDMISKEFKNEEFFIEEGGYPQIKAIEKMEKQAQMVSRLSGISVKTESNLSALETAVIVEEKNLVQWNGENANIVGGIVAPNGDTGVISATTNRTMNRFALRNAKSGGSILSGASTTSATTQISIPVKMGTYYKVEKKGDAVGVPKTHKEAIEAGWKLMYWTGTYKWGGLSWNTEYEIFTSDLTQNVSDGTVKTSYGKLGGKIALTGTYAVGETMTATLSDTNTTKGTIYFETANTLDATVWDKQAEISMDGTQNTAEYTVENTEASKYLRVRFVASQETGYEGTLIASTDSVVKNQITAVTLANKTPGAEGTFTLGDHLVASIEPAGRENEVEFTWYQKDKMDTPLGAGRNYTLKGSDIGKQVCVKAVAKANGDLKGEMSSELTDTVQTKNCENPDATSLKQISVEDITATLKMDVAEGLYRFGIATSEGGEKIAYPIHSRGGTQTTITGLTAKTDYYIYVQQVGEDGYKDSQWSTGYLKITTDKEHVRGDVVISGEAVYGKTLTAEIKNKPTEQTGDLAWYRLDADGKRGTKTTGDTYTLGKEDIGFKIEAVYEGNGEYAGEVSTVSNMVAKEERTAPTTNLTVTSTGGTYVNTVLPVTGEQEKYIIGISHTQSGVPIEQLEDGKVKELDPDAAYDIKNLERDTEYYLFVRFAENDTHQKSDWIAVDKAVKVQTAKQAFAGTIDFTYETTGKLMKGQTVTATLNPSDPTFNFKGEWTWTRVAGDKTETAINNFALTNDKQGTTYVVPNNEEIGVTYKVTFTASVGFEGSASNTSAAVQERVKTQYATPDSSKIIMEKIDDTSIKVKISEGEGLYRFWYKKEAASPFASIAGAVAGFFSGDDGYVDSGKDVYSNTDVVIEKLDRNSKYMVKVQRIGDENGDASEFAMSKDSSIFAITEKTEIAGSVTIAGTEKYNETLTATYHPASYASTGSTDDTAGTWQWYRGTTKIEGASTNTYKTTTSDVGQILKVEYLMPENSDFVGNTSATTRQIEKVFCINPSISDVASTFNQSTKIMEVRVQGSVSTDQYKVYYRLQLKGETPPIYPTSGMLDKWTESKSNTTTFLTDSDGREFQPQGEYVVYVIQTATPTMEGSAVISKEFKIGAMTQTGKIALSGRTHVNKEAVATLSDNNNLVGEWHWFYSDTDYNTANPSSWVELKSGFSPKNNWASSVLVVPDEAKGKFLKAKFVSTDDKHNGSVEAVSSTTVTKTMTEKLEISGKGYAGQTVKVTLTGSDRTIGSLTTKLIQFKSASEATGFDYTNIKNVTDKSFEAVLPGIVSTYDNGTIRPIINFPDRKIYTNEDGTPYHNETTVDDTWLTVKTQDRITLHTGIPITNAEEMQQFIAGAGTYANRGQSYVITNNINLKGKPTTPTAEPFTGTLNGDYHTVSNARATFEDADGAIFFQKMEKATVQNLILSNFQVENTGFRKSTAILVGSAKDSLIKRVMVVSSTVTGNGDVAYLAGKLTGVDTASSAKNAILECAIVGGQAHSTLTDTYSVGGLAGSAWASYISDNFAVNSSISKDGSTAASGTLIGSVHAGEGVPYNPMTYKNNYVANIINGGLNGAIIGGFWESKNHTYSNNFYDKTLAPDPALGGDEGFHGDVNDTPVSKNAKGIGKATKEMIGSGLSANYGTTLWTFAEGFYPRLKWNADHAITKLYTTTAAAFNSVDGKTTLADLKDGNVKGSLQVPEGLQGSAYTYQSSNPAILKVSKTGIITPVGTGTAEITVTYTEPDSNVGGSASNPFKLTSKVTLGTFDSVELTGSPGIGNTISAKVLPVDKAPGATYQWYRKLNTETGNGTAIAGATDGEYKITKDDIGYQLRAICSKSGFGSMASTWTSSVQTTAPSSAPTVESITDSSATIVGQGGINPVYEFAYATSIDGEKILVGNKGATATINGLARNKTYYVWSRMPKGDGYATSNWSPAGNFSTAKTNVVGNVTFGTNINKGQQLAMTAPTTNDQKGTWSLKRVEKDGTTEVGDITFSSSSNIANYTLASEDVGYRIKATFTGTADYKDQITEVSDVVKKSTSTAPTSPTRVSSTDASITVQVTGSGNFDIGYASEANGEIITSLTDQSAAMDLVIPNLLRNKTYYVYSRTSVTGSAEASPWSLPTQMKTTTSKIAGTIAVTGTARTGETISFIVDETNDQRGTWKLERQEGTSSTTISPSAYSIENTGRTLHYTLTPKDAKGTMKATFSGNGDFHGTIEKTTETISEATQTEDEFPSVDNITISNVKDYSLEIKTGSGKEIYQFGYVLKDGAIGNITAVDATAGAGTSITINELSRNTAYDLYMRKAAKVGYNPGIWHKMTTATTDRSALTGTVNYQKWDETSASWKDAKVGVADIGGKYKANYTQGTYAPAADDSSSGNWQWYANNVAIPGATSSEYTIAAMEGNIEITVKYVAKPDSDFKESRNASIGTLTKPAYDAPSTLPTVTALDEDGEPGSRLQIKCSDVANVYYYVQKATVGTIPPVVLSSTAEGNKAEEGKWFKAETQVTLILDPNIEYVVYASRLEDGGHKGSGVVSQRGERTVKENLTKISSVDIKELDDTKWKVQQEKELRMSIADKPVDGVWQYYVSKDKNNADSWINVTSEIKDVLVEGKGDKYSFTKVTMPIKYSNDYFVKVIFTGRGNVEGTKTYISTNKLTGTQIQGHVEIHNGAESEVFVPIEVKYVYGKDATSQDIVDETNGIWTWYRETGLNSNKYAKIQRDPKVGLIDSYTPTAEDVDRRIYAVYTSAPTSIYSGSVESNKSNNTEKTNQNTPEDITLKQVNGTTVQINLPTNIKTDGKTIAQPVLEYRKSGETDWKTNTMGDAWIGKDADKLKAKTDYEVRAFFGQTSEYKKSDVSKILTIKTGNQSFNEANLSVTASGKSKSVETGSTVKATFTGPGFDDGYFKVLRSDGTVLNDKISGKIESNTISATYEIQSADIGDNIIVQYCAKVDASTYGGYIEKNTEVVLKPANPDKPQSPTLEKIRLHEDQLKVLVNDACEYVLNTSDTKVSEEGDWQKLTKNKDGEYLFDGLTKSTDYYLHVRFAETTDFRPSDEAASAKTSPWESQEYAITYNGTEGAQNSNPTKYTELSGTITLEDASKDGYTFTGWTTDGITTPTKNIQILSGSDGAKTFTANWQRITYVITYNLNGGSLASGSTNPSMYTVDNLSFTLNNPTKTGYTFDGWTWDGETTATKPVTVEKGTHQNFDFVANWTINQYTATFDVNGGDVLTSNTIEKNYDEELGTLPTPTKKGHKFIGWFTEATDGTQITAETKMPVSGGTYFAHWTIKRYTATFDVNGGDVLTSNTIEKNYDAPLGDLEIPTRVGYTFKGWFTEATGGTQITAETKMPVSGGTYFAHWTINQYTATFDVKGGSAVTPNTIERDYDAKLDALPTTTKNGYTFEGWFTQETGGTQITRDTKMPAQNTIYFAHWTATEYDISYNLNGGTNAGSNPATYTIETEDITLQEPTRANYDFSGWTWDGQDEPKKEVKIAKGTTGQKAYIANWTGKRYMVTFESNGGNSVTAISGTYDATIAAPNEPTKEGYAFKGWYKENTITTKWNFNTDKVQGEMTLYADWEINHYTVTFNSKGGSLTNEQSVDHGAKATKPGTPPTKEHYAFEGWYSDDQCTTSFDFEALIKSNTTIYANWTPKAYDITYDLDGGTNAAVNPQTYTIESDDIVLQQPTREDKSFTGWTWAGQDTPQKKVTISKGTTGNKAYTAKWGKKEHTVTFDSNGGSSVTSQKVIPGDKINRPANPTKIGLIFLGWYKDAQLKEPWNFATDTVTDDLTLYAGWEQPPLIVLKAVTASETGMVKKHTSITLSSEEGTTIYYTVDGSIPSRNSLKYKGGIFIDQTMTVKAIAVKDGYGDSNVATFSYTVKGDGDVKFEKDSPIKSGNTPDEVIAAVLTEKEYEDYLAGTDVHIRIKCDLSAAQINDMIKKALAGRTIGVYYDISIYKTIGNQAEKMVATLRKPIRLILTIPNKLYPKQGVKRVFEVMRVHEDEATMLKDLDKNKKTATVESSEFSTYILCYKDGKTSGKDTPVDKPSTGGNGEKQGTNKPLQQAPSTKTEDGKDNSTKKVVIKPSDKEESKSAETTSLMYYVAIALAIAALMGSVIVMKLRRKNKE